MKNKMIWSKHLNPLMKLADIAAIAKITTANDIYTSGRQYLCYPFAKPLDLGADV
jgi:cystathionine beta-lyase